MQIIPTQIVSDIGNDIPFNAKIWLPSGRKINVQFDQQSQTLTHLASLFKECQETSGSILVVSYKGAGIFSVYILNDDGTEIKYILPENTSFDTVCRQGIKIIYLFHYRLT